MRAEQDRPQNPPEPPPLECDIVMAGGVTSGIIYPGAVAMIARRYSFRSIGGTSVGAIAAAVTAAAEYGRRTGKNPSAFEQISEIPKSLGEVAADGHSRLFHLFAPETATKPLLALVTPLFARRGRPSQILAIFIASMSWYQIALPVAFTLIIGLTVSAALVVDGREIYAAIALLMMFTSVVVVWVCLTANVLTRSWLPAWRRNGYGICTGIAVPGCKSRPDQAPFEALTNWTHARVQAAAGRRVNDAPLTFGDLWTASATSATDMTAADAAAPRTIELAMIASDISRNRTVQLPFFETPSPLYVETAVLKSYFPPSIVEWMTARAGSRDERVECRNDVIRLPRPQDLPIVFGARLSLSFPILLSALPLMTPDFAKRRSVSGRIPLRRVWFSDGGLTSNFPIHFFDSPLPSRPTFCLNLVDFDAEAPNLATYDGESDEELREPPSGADKPIAQPRAASRTAAQRPAEVSPRDPKPNDPVWGFVSMAKGTHLSPAPFTAFDTAPNTGLGSFFLTLLNTARFWSDNQMLIAPGVRDRVVNIALRDDEGGLNLDMSPKVIADLDLRGRAAGLLISARFDPSESIDPETGDHNEQVFAQHRWVRFRSFMAAFEDLTRRFALSRRASDAAAAARGEAHIDDMIGGSAGIELGYPAPQVARPYYFKVSHDLERLAQSMAASTKENDKLAFDWPSGGREGSAPKPKMRIRLRPIVDNDPRAETSDLPGPR